MPNLRIRRNIKGSLNKAKEKNVVDKLNLKIVKNHLVTARDKLRKKTPKKLKLLNGIIKGKVMVDVRVGNNRKTGADGVGNNNKKGVNNNNSTELETNVCINSDLTSIIKIKGDIGITSAPQSEENIQTVQSTSHVDNVNTVRKISNSYFECDYCHKTFDIKSQLERHMYIHLKVRPYKCVDCQRKFKKSCNLKVHIVKKHIDSANIEIFICDLCNISFFIKENLSLHLSNHTRGVTFFKCAFCEKKFSNHIYLSEHERHHLKIKKKYKCTKCDKTFLCRSKLALHTKSHINIKDFVCQYCGKEFLRPNSIKRHVEICHSGFRIQCPICNKKLKGHLTEHLRTHEKSKPHKCLDCGQRFTQSTQLTVHRRTHTGDRPFKCRICGQSFSHSNAMLLHFRRHTGEKPFQCIMCPLMFSQLPHMKTHVMKIHRKTDFYKCNKCNEFFKMKRELDCHLKICKNGECEMSVDEKMGLSIQAPEIDSVMNLSRMRFLLALLLTMITTKSKLKCLGVYTILNIYHYTLLTDAQDIFIDVLAFVCPAHHNNCIFLLIFN